VTSYKRETDRQTERERSEWYGVGGWVGGWVGWVWVCVVLPRGHTIKL
jgi:hypothetical protein